MDNTYTLTRLGWRLLEWAMMGGTYNGLKQLVLESASVEDLAKHIAYTTPVNYQASLAFAEDVFEPMKEIEHREIKDVAPANSDLV